MYAALYAHKNQRQTEHNGRKRPQINKHEIHVFSLLFFPIFHSARNTFFMSVFALVLRRCYVSWGCLGLMNKYGRIFHRHRTRRICFHFYNFGTAQTSSQEMIWKIRHVESFLISEAPRDMSKGIKNNSLSEPLFSITMELYWVRVRSTGPGDKHTSDVHEEVQSI